MIFSIFLYMIGFFASVIAVILPSWQIIPDIVFSAIDYFLAKLLTLGNIFIFIPTLLEAFNWFLHVFSYLMIFLIVKKIFNYARGTGSGL